MQQVPVAVGCAKVVTRLFSNLMGRADVIERLPTRHVAKAQYNRLGIIRGHSREPIVRRTYLEVVVRRARQGWAEDRV